MGDVVGAVEHILEYGFVVAVCNGLAPGIAVAVLEAIAECLDLSGGIDHLLPASGIEHCAAHQSPGHALVYAAPGLRLCRQDLSGSLEVGFHEVPHLLFAAEFLVLADSGQVLISARRRALSPEDISP